MFKPVPQVHRIDQDTALLISWNFGVRGIGSTYQISVQRRGSRPRFIGVITCVAEGRWGASYYDRTFTKDAFSDKITELSACDSAVDAALSILLASTSAKGAGYDPSKYTVVERQGFAGMSYFLYTTEARRCIGSYCEALTRGNWITNSSVASRGQVFQSQAAAAAALVDAWEQNEKIFKELNQARLTQLLASAL